MSEEARPPARAARCPASPMGALSALIVGPCVAAPLAGALLYIGQTGDAVLGGTALFVMALGMGAPLLAVGVAGRHAAAQDRPVDGRRQEGLRRAAAGHRRLAGLAGDSGRSPQMLAWALLLIVPAIYMHALDPLPPHAKGWHVSGKASASSCCSPAPRCWSAPWPAPRSAAATGRPARQRHRRRNENLPFERVASVAELEARIKAAGKPVMLDFYADWCVSCKEMERFTFADARVQQTRRLHAIAGRRHGQFRRRQGAARSASICSARRASFSSTPRVRKTRPCASSVRPPRAGKGRHCRRHRHS
jgi:thiol:disulfide interchange protein DsbD